MKIMSNKVSIIVPVYNAERTIDRCIDSLINQTYKNIEIILINDGSKDNSLILLEEYSDYKQVKIINQKNAGPGAAKNVGLNNIKGDYVFFVDSDDFIQNQTIEILMNIVIKEGLDLVQCNYEKGTSNIFNDKSLEVSYTLMDNHSVFQSVFANSVMWGKIIKAEVLENIRFDEGKPIDDESIVYKVYYKSNKIAYTNSKLYYYTINTKGIMHSNRPVDMSFIETMDNRLIYFKERNEETLYSLSLKHYLKVLIIKYRKMLKNKSNSKYNKSVIKMRFLEVYKLYRSDRRIDKKYNSILYLFYIYCCLIK